MDQAVGLSLDKDTALAIYSACMRCTTCSWAAPAWTKLWVHVCSTICWSLCPISALRPTRVQLVPPALFHYPRLTPLWTCPPYRPTLSTCTLLPPLHHLLHPPALPTHPEFHLSEREVTLYPKNCPLPRGLLLLQHIQPSPPSFWGAIPPCGGPGEWINPSPLLPSSCPSWPALPYLIVSITLDLSGGWSAFHSEGAKTCYWVTQSPGGLLYHLKYCSACLDDYTISCFEGLNTNV